MILLLFVMVCAWKFPSKHPKHWHLRFCWHGSFGLAKASKVCAATWHMIWNSTMGGSIFYSLYPGDENFDAKRNMARFANNDCCWHILLTTTNPQEMSCWNQLRGPVSHRFSSWIAVNFATAATNSCNQQPGSWDRYHVISRPWKTKMGLEQAHTPDAKKTWI